MQLTKLELRQCLIPDMNLIREYGGVYSVQGGSSDSLKVLPTITFVLILIVPTF